jgi:hypothetical protein
LVPSCACAEGRASVTLAAAVCGFSDRNPCSSKERALSENGFRYTPEQGKRLQEIHAKLAAARRELDALIGDAYLRPRASIVPVHFLDLASAVEKLRWAEKEWRELDKELAGDVPFPTEFTHEDDDRARLSEPADLSVG